MKIKSFDFFRKLPKDIETSSVSGGVFSIIAIIIGLLLFLSEYRYFLSEEIIKEMIIDNDQATTTMRVNLNFTFLRVPCLGLGLDQEDEIGNHKLDVSDTLTKIRLNEKEERIPERFGEGHPNYWNSEQETNDFINALKNKEKCMIVGHIIVPGNFHISYHARRDLLNKLIEKGETGLLMNLDIAHKINVLSFGTPINQGKTAAILKDFKTIHPNFTPYNNITKIADSKNNYNTFIKVIPNIFKDEQNQLEISTYQFSMNSRFSPTDPMSMPSTYYNYEVSPITVVYKVQKNSFIHFWVQICAIVGGIFAVIGIINSITFEFCRCLKRAKTQQQN